MNWTGGECSNILSTPPPQNTHLNHHLGHSTCILRLHTYCDWSLFLQCLYNKTLLVSSMFLSTDVLVYQGYVYVEQVQIIINNICERFCVPLHNISPLDNKGNETVYLYTVYPPLYSGEICLGT